MLSSHSTTMPPQPFALVGCSATLARSRRGTGRAKLLAKVVLCHLPEELGRERHLCRGQDRINPTPRAEGGHTLRYNVAGGRRRWLVDPLRDLRRCEDGSAVETARPVALCE